MTMHRCSWIAAGLAAAGSLIHAQASPTKPPAPLPTTLAAIGPWDVAIVKRAGEILASPALWNRADTSTCPAGATTFSVYCALQKAVDEATGVRSDQRHVTTGPAPAAALANCRIPSTPSGWVGSCGFLFDEAPFFTVSPVKATTTGRWRADIQPSAVWAGTMTDAVNPVFDEAGNVVDQIAAKKYSARLIGYNNDSTTTFANVQTFFHLLAERLATLGASGGLDPSVDDVEIELYPGGTGVIRTYTGWFAVSGFVARDSIIGFRIDTAQEVPPSALDREIIQRAAKILSSDAVWNRADNRKCPPTETTWSIYCALEQASIDVTGGFHHRRPALELVREIVDDRTKNRTDYNHRLMDYNNDQTTHLEDVRSLFAEALARIK